MPEVAGKKFPYTAGGIEAAAKAAHGRKKKKGKKGANALRPDAGEMPSFGKKGGREPLVDLDEDED